MENFEKFKNKKIKDVIIADNQITAKTQDDLKVSNHIDNEPDINTKNRLDDLNIEKKERIEISKSNESIINNIIFNMQLLLSMTNKVDIKLVSVFSHFLSQENLKVIIEERDCRDICCSLSCGKKLQKSNDRKYYYNPFSKDFMKEDLLNLFCDVKCFQKFKEISQITLKFDYFRFLKIESICFFYIISEFYPENIYIKKISDLAYSILVKDKILDNTKMGDILNQTKDKYSKVFMESNDINSENESNHQAISINLLFEN